MDALINSGYIAASILFIVGLKMLSSPKTARRGNALSALGMLVAIIATLLSAGLSYQWIATGLVIGSVVGSVSALKVKMTAMPEMVAVFNGFGGGASLLVAWSEYHSEPFIGTLAAIAIFLAVLIGGVTFTGSMVAYAKLAEIIPGKPILFKSQKVVNAAIMALILLGGLFFIGNPNASYPLFLAVVAASLVLGVLTVIPIGGADMPVVIALLNSYSGIAASMAGFILLNTLLIIAGSLVGASGIILTNIMCKAMNRSIFNVLFSGFGAEVHSQGGEEVKGQANPINTYDAYCILEAAQSVVFVPGYGMAVAQAQHAVRELAEHLDANGTEVKYAIHPVAGRMPGHMNVLLAEADVPYEELVEPKDVNPHMPNVDVVLIIGANDIVNPAAKEQPSSPIYGMPVIDVDLAKTCIILKRSLNPGFAGLDNPLFYKENSRMLFGDAKESVLALINEFQSE